METTRRARWQQISDELRDRIHDGRYAAGFPGELEIAAEFSVSRGTAREALRPLRESGLIVAARGKRPHVASLGSDSQYGAIYSLEELISGAGAHHSSVALRQQITQNADAAAHLGIEGNEAVFHLKRVRLSDGIPIAHDEVFSPASLAANLIDADFAEAAFYAEFASRCGVVIDGGSEHVQAVSAGDELALLLDCAPHTPLLLVERLATAGGRLVEYRRTHFLGDRFRAEHPFGAGIEERS